MEIWLSPHPLTGFDHWQARARVYGTGDGRPGRVSVGDVGRFVVESLDDPAGRDATVELGPDWLSHVEVIRIFEEIGGRPFDVDHVPEEAIQQQLDSPDEYVQTFGHLARAMADGTSRQLDDGELTRTFALRLSSVRDYAQRVVHPETTRPDGRPSHAQPHPARLTRRWFPGDVGASLPTRPSWRSRFVRHGQDGLADARLSAGRAATVVRCVGGSWRTRAETPIISGCARGGESR
jgi:hypothetical protein